MDPYTSSQQHVSVPIDQFPIHNHNNLPSKPQIPNKRINPTHPHAPYYSDLARQPLIWRAVSAILLDYDMANSQPKETRFALFCRSKQAIHDETTILDEWERERTLEEDVIGEFYDSLNGNYSQWVKNHDQMEMEFKISRNRVVEAYWTEQSRVAMQEYVKAECYNWRVQEQAGAQIKSHQERAEARRKSEQEKEAARLREKELSNTLTRNGFKESVQERARVTLQAQKKQAIKSTSSTSSSGSPNTATTVPTRPVEEIRQELRDKVHAKAELVNMVKPRSPSSPSSSSSESSPSSSRRSVSSTYAIATLPTSTPVSLSPPRKSFSPTAQEFEPSPPVTTSSAIAPPLESSDPAILYISPPLPVLAPQFTLCRLAYCRKRNAPGTIKSQTQAWARGAAAFLKLELRLRSLNSTAANPFFEPEGYTDFMQDKLNWREQVAWIRGYDETLRERLLKMDAWELERYEKGLKARIERREREMRRERMRRAG